MKYPSLTPLYRCLAALALAAFLAPAGAVEQEYPYRDFNTMTPSGTVEFEITSVKLIVGGTWGEGVLHYQGQRYPLRVSALSVGGFGVKSMKGQADVFGLESIDDFPGTYGGGAVGFTVGDASAGKAVLENGRKVVLRLKLQESEGLQMSTGLSGFEIEFAQ